MAPARNGGVAVSRGEILAFIDSDCVAEPEWLEEALKGLEGLTPPESQPEPDAGEEEEE